MKTIVPEMIDIQSFSSMPERRMDIQPLGISWRKASWERSPGNQIRAALKCAAPHVVRQRVLTVASPPKASNANAAKIRKPS